MRFNAHAFKRLTEPTPVAADPAGAPCLPARMSADSGPDAVSAAFICAYGRPTANQIPVPEGSLAVTLSLRFNDSAAQVDYFSYHCGCGCPDFIVLLVKKQAHTEALARKALTACPELHALDWKWQSEKYGGGNGNYLISSPIEIPASIRSVMTAKHTFSGQPVTHACWEIQFTKAWRNTALWPHKHYGAAVVQSAFSNGRDSGRDAVTSPITAAWCLNERMRGVEIHFTRRPDDATLAPLRADRAWNYTGRTKCWYARQTDATVAWAKAFCENFNGGTATPPAPLAAILPSLPEREPAPIPVLASATVPPPSPSRPERKFIRFTAHPSDSSDPSEAWQIGQAAADRQPAFLASCTNYFRNPTTETPISIADLMRPKV
jgi:hypothetical protein